MAIYDNILLSKYYILFMKYLKNTYILKIIFVLLYAVKPTCIFIFILDFCYNP